MHENGFNESANETSLQDLEQLPDAQSAELLAEFERRRRVWILYIFLKFNCQLGFFFYLKARQIHVSTDDNEVRTNLRALSEPICMTKAFFKSKHFSHFL